MNIEIYPSCPYCGNQFIPDHVFITAQEAEEYAIMQCKCEEAKEKQVEITAIKKRDENIKQLENSLELFKAYCQKKKVLIKDELIENLLTNAILVLDNVIGSAAFVINPIKIKISTNSKGNIVLSYSYSVSEKIEV